MQAVAPPGHCGARPGCRRPATVRHAGAAGIGPDPCRAAALCAGLQRGVPGLEPGPEPLHVHRPQEHAAKALALDQAGAAGLGNQPEEVLAVEQP